MTFRILTPVAFLLGTTGMALAAGPTATPSEPVVMQPAPAPVSTGGDWQGGYAGVQLGYGFGEFSVDTDDFDADGIVGGLHLGYNWDLGDWVVGPELQYDAGDLSFDDEDGEGSFDNIARLKMRAGRDLGQGLLYGSAGLAYTNFDGVSGVTDIDFDDPGYVVGVGYDYKMSESWTLGGEYQYHMFDDFGEDGNDVDFSTVHLKASYNF